MEFKDRVVEHPRRIKLTAVSGTTYDYEAVTGEVAEAGTPVNAENLNKLIQRDGDDIKDTVVAFAEAGTRANIATGEKTSTIFGKIKKWFTDLKPHAFTTPSATLNEGTASVPSDKVVYDEFAKKAPLDNPAFTGTVTVPITPSGPSAAVAKSYADSLLPYDKVIRTQTEFNELINSPTWLDAKSVALVGQFTYSEANNSGIKVPATVKQIHGFNSAKITVTNFVYNSTAKGGLWYNTAPTTNDYNIRDLEVDCTGTGPYGIGFTNCTNLLNCTGRGTATSSGWGFYFCTNLTNCTGTGTGTGTNSDGLGFRSCTNLANCTGTGTGPYGIGFYLVDYASNCRDGGSTTNMWGGSNKNIGIDDSSAQTITGVKTFTASPIVPTTPSGPSAAVSKSYADGLSTPYDKVIRNQTEFNALISSPTWLGATSVALVGQFTYSEANNKGIKVPATVKQIHGFNSAKITVTNFVYNVNVAKGGLWYDTLPTTNDYSIRDLEVDCTGTGKNGNGYGFTNCTNLTNCAGTGTGLGAYGIGFSYCSNLTNCTGTGTGTNGWGFYIITYASNCKDGGSSTNMWGGTNKNIDIETCRKIPTTENNSTLNA